MDVNAQTRIDPATTVGAVRLTVSDLERSRSFYQQVLGLSLADRDDGVVSVSAGGQPLVELHGNPSAPPLDRGAPGLFHLAILMPDRRALAMALARVASAPWPLTGASDHLVSEALYLSDPDGNGIEIYRDRPEDQWPRAADGDGGAMINAPLDLQALLAEAG